MAGWTLLQLRNEFLSRGFDYFSTTRANLYLNHAYHELCAAELWPFLEATTSGSPPLTIADLRTIRTVRETTTNAPLSATDVRTLVDQYTILTTTGTPCEYYLEAGVLKTYPVGGTLEVRYWTIPATLAADGDVSVVPDRYGMVIVDIAVKRALLDDNDAGDQQAVAQEIENTLNRMRQDLLWQDVFHAPSMEVVWGSAE